MTKKDNNINSVSNTIDLLVELRHGWEQGTYAASNAELYALLSKVLDLYIKVRSDVGLARAVTDLLNIQKITYNNSTTLAVKIVRLVFVGTEHDGKVENRAYAYARVLTVAADKGIEGADLPKFIIESNGIEAIRRNGTDGLSDAKKAQQNRDHADFVLADKAPIASVIMTDALQPVDGARYSCVFRGHPASDSESIRPPIPILSGH